MAFEQFQPLDGARLVNAGTANESPRPRVLIVDDNELLRTLLRSILRSGGYQVIGEAKNGIVALELAQRLRPDIICMDVIMPQMGGLEALQTIKAMAPEVAVVMITGTASVDNVRQSMHSGASGFIVKPFKAGKILDTIKQAWRSAQPGTTTLDSDPETA